MPRLAAKSKSSRRPHRKVAKKTPVGRLRGKGAYSYDNPGPWGRFGRYVGSTLGQQFAGDGGGKLGSAIGGLAHYIGRIFGSGDYVMSPGVKSNSIMQPQAPSFQSSATSIRVRHREFLGDIISSSTAGAFSISSFSINPGLAASFPWLSSVCGSTFQQYRLNGMCFEYRSMSSDALNSTNTALGQVVMCTDYDSADQAFSSKQQMENTEFGVSCKPSSNMIHAIECAPRLTTATELYVRAYSNPSGTDIRLYDWGRFYVATNGFQGTNVNCGELWVSYDVTLIKAIEQPPGYLTDFVHYNLSGASALTPLALDTSVNATQPAYNTFPGSFTITSTVLKMPLTIQVGSVFMLSYMIRGGSTASLVSPAITFSGGLVTDLTANGFSNKLGFINSTSAGYAAPQTATGTTICNVIIFAYVGGGTAAVPPTITFGTSGTFPGATLQGGDLHIMQLPSVPA